MHDVSEVAAPPRVRIRGDLVGAGIAAALVATAFIVPRIANPQWVSKLYAASAPIFGSWIPHIGWGTGPAIVIAAFVAVQGPALAERLPWRRLLAMSWITATGWTFSLAMVDGWRRGFTNRFNDPNEYLHEVGGVTDIGAMLHGFADRILDFQPDSWTTHVSGHPPGALLFFVLLDRIGLGGSTWAALACMLIGTSAVVAVAVALRALGAEDRARAALPFLTLAPAAVWIAVSADAMFAGVTAWAVALLALAARPAGSHVSAVAAGILFGLGIYLSYGLTLMALPAVAVLIARRTLRPLLPAVAGALVVVAAFTLSGFWWVDGYHLVVERYYQGVAKNRPYAYWWWGNLAATVCAVGLATAAALHRALSPKVLRALDPTALLVAAALCAILAADISGLSKAETERIWLPFDMWLLAATAFLPRSTARGWLAVQSIGTLVLVHTILTNW
ncbi:hypothetical protein OG203_13425 [Nocardia sp. NBC_01499]|uniref:hypothetical protein n=1 Tax=Nocardia sp. NBC_01499 TaxID=2903597 RepID=UPI00386BA3AD